MWGTLLMLVCGIFTVQSSSTGSPGPCKQDDGVCLNKLVTAMYRDSVIGVPSLNIPNLDPTRHDEIVAHLATVQYKLINTTLEGFTQCYVKKTKLFLEKNLLLLDMICPAFTLDGDYEVDGKILEWPIQGNGDFDIYAKDFHLNIEGDMKITENEDGKKYISFRGFRYTGGSRGGVIFDLRNLFNGQKYLAENLLKIINQNWRLVARELQGPIIKANVKKLIKNFNKYLHQKPLDTLIVLE